MAIKRQSNQVFVANAAVMHDDSTGLPVPTGDTNPLPVAVSGQVEVGVDTVQREMLAVLKRIDQRLEIISGYEMIGKTED